MLLCYFPHVAKFSVSNTQPLLNWNCRHAEYVNPRDVSPPGIDALAVSFLWHPEEWSHTAPKEV